MAITGEFRADFKQFNDAVTNARKHLTDFSAGADRAGGRLNAMQDAFSGKKIFQEATLITEAVERAGGASVLTARQMADVNARLTEAIAKYAALGQQAPPAMVALANATKQVEAPTEGLSTKMIALGAAIGTMAANAAMALGRLALQGIKSVASGIAELVMEGPRISGLENSFQTLATTLNESGAAMLGAMREGTRGLVTDLDLMSAANKAVLLGLPVTADEMGQLSQTATVLGRAMGLGPTQAFDNLITALGRSSPLILDNLGLSVKVGEANEVYAAKIGKTVAQLTDADEKTAFYNAAMVAARDKVQALGEQHDSLGDSIKRAGIWWGNFKDDLSIAIARSPAVAAAMSSIGTAVSAAFGTDSSGRVQTLTALVDALALKVVTAGEHVVTFGRVWATVFGVLTTPVTAVGAAVSFMVERFAAGIAAIADLATKVPGLGGAFEGVAGAARVAAAGMAAVRETTAGLAEGSFNLATGQGAVHGAFDKAAGVLGAAKTAMLAATDTAGALATGLDAGLGPALARTTTNTGAAATAFAGLTTSMKTAMAAKMELFAPQPKDVTIDFRPAGALATILAENTAIREQAEALTLVEQQTKDNYLEIGNYATAHALAGDAAKEGTDKAIHGYAALTSGIGAAIQAADRFIVSHRTMMELGEAQRQFNQGRATGTQEALLRGFEIVTARGGAPSGGGGGITVIQNNQGAFFNTPADTQRFAEQSGNAVKAQLMAHGRQVT